MALVGFEWIVIGAIILIVLLFRPRVITDLAKSLGQVAAEFKKGKNESERQLGNEDLLAETAERLGIKTQGKTPAQIREEILAKAGRDDR